MRDSLGCAFSGVMLMVVLYFLFFFAAMIEPGLAILIMVAGIFIATGTVVAFVVWLAAVLRRRD